MIAFLRRWLHNRFVQPKLDALRDEWSRRYNDLSERLPQANRTAMVLSQETYETKVLRHIGNTTVTQQDNEHSTAFKLGIQHALRHIERECVAK